MNEGTISRDAGKLCAFMVSGGRAQQSSISSLVEHVSDSHLRLGIKGGIDPGGLN